MANIALLIFALVSCTCWSDLHCKAALADEAELSASVDTWGDGDDVTLLQTKLEKTRSPGQMAGTKHLLPKNGDLVCKEMNNRGAYFDVEVQVGTPSQSFNIVADSGSNALIVPDCRCVNGGLCNTLETCFQTRDSTSFVLEELPNQGGVPMATLSYGSGSIVCSIATETVAIGSIETKMADGVFLMESRQALDITGDFEGILGLGLPGSDIGIYSPQFMVEAGVSRFSLCFNDKDPGILGMNVPPLTNPMYNIGQVHWGLDLQGMTVGNATTPVLFCDPAHKRSEQATACGAIPDSGTTLMMGPADQIHTLFGAICTAWPRCNEIARQHMMVAKSQIFLELLQVCGDWLDAANGGVNEVPSITLHFVGVDGKPRLVEMSAWSYIVETEEPVFKILHARVPGFAPMQILLPSGRSTVRCSPLVGAQDYVTEQNGPVWIIGSPLFFENTVSFDTSTAPATIAINPEPCTKCGDVSLLASSFPSRRSRMRRLNSLRDSSIARDRRV